VLVNRVGQQLQIAVELLPGAKKAGMPINVASVVSAVQRRDAEKVAAALRVELVVVDVRTKDETSTALRGMANSGVDVAVIHADPLFYAARQQLAALAEALRLPAVYGLREHAEDGGLMSYGMGLRANWRRAADFVDKILKGANPAELPIELPSKLELVVNLKTARALGLEIPPTLLARTDEVIE
jgi:putative tryptophan/tyrosine transport system substrate-binding protein